MRTPWCALAVLLLVSGCGFSLQNAPMGRNVDGPSYTITAEFTDVSGLPIGGKVRLGPATVGRVHSVRAVDFVAHVEIKMRQDAKLSKGTRAGLELSTALGDQFIALKPPKRPTGELIGDGDRIPLADTIRGPDIEDTMALLGQVLNNSGIEHTRTVVTELNIMLDGREGKARALLGRADSVLDSLESRIDDFNSTLRSVNKLGKTVTDNRELLERTLIKIRPAIDVLRRQQGNFNNLMRGVDGLASDVNGALSQTQATFKSQLIKLGPIVDELNAIDGDLGATLRNFKTFSDLFQRAAPGDYLNLDGIANVPDSVAGVLGGLPDFIGGGSASGADAVGELLNARPAPGSSRRGTERQTSPPAREARDGGAY